MVGGPPERAVLDRRAPGPREQELDRPGRPERPVGEVPVVADGDPEPAPEPDDGEQDRVAPGGHQERGGEQGRVGQDGGERVAGHPGDGGGAAARGAEHPFSR